MNVLSLSRAYLQLARIEDVENDVLLPPMEHNMIYMDLDNYALRSYNAMQASLAINAIDSQREGRVGQHRLILCCSVAQLVSALPFPPKCTSQGIFAMCNSTHLSPSTPECQGTTDGYKQFVTVSHWANFSSYLAISEITIFRSLFWSSSDILYNVDEICRLAAEYMNRAVHREPGREASPEDLDLLRRALKHAYGLSSLH